MKSFLLFRQIFKAKFLAFLTRTLIKTGGTSLPGIAVEKRYPHLLEEIGKDFEEIILISGTNGKSTTRALLVQAFEKGGQCVCTNLGGANLIRGIATSLLLNLNFLGKPKAKIAILEVEEASLPKLTEYLKPTTLILTNLFRDQLDAYTEIDQTVAYFRQSLLNLGAKSKTEKGSEDKSAFKLIYNAEDGKLFNLVSEFRLQSQSFGLNIPEVKKPKYELKSVFPKGFKLDLVAEKVTTKNFQTSFVVQKSKQKSLEFKTKLPGIYNIYNILAAFLAIPQSLQTSFLKNLKDFEPVFGRGEKIQLKNQSLHLFLIKNPAGLNQVLNLIEDNFEEKKVNLIFCINDNIADGRDVSWLWDADLETFIAKQKTDELLTSGNRAWDMLLRLEYAGALVSEDQAFLDMNALVQKIEETGKDFVILSNYTATLELRKILSKKVGLKQIQDRGN